jgi:hypothetical protein
MKFTIHRIFGFVATGIVSVALVWGFVIVGSPATQRAYRFDERRVSDLRAIQKEIMLIVHEGQMNWSAERPTSLRHPLPSTLTEVVTLARNQRLSITDPETGEAYEYIVKDATHFDLCARFNQPRQQQYDIFWDHPAGRHCFSFDALSPDGYAIGQ